MTLREYILGDENIYLAIYAVKSYVFDPELLSREDKEMLNALSDPFNVELIKETITSVKTILKKIIDDEDYRFKVEVYYKPKDYKNGEIEYRPIHTASLLQLITMVTMLHPLIYEIPNEENSWKLNLSNYSRLIPNNFYGNRVSEKPEELFKKWNGEYKTYTQKANEYFKTYHVSKEYRYELKLDLEKFFPSVNPLLVYQIMMEHMPVTFSNEDEKVFKNIILKLLVCEVTNLRTDAAKKIYYINETKNTKYTKGIAQGLPQSYFFGNICMIEIGKIFDIYFEGKSVYYVDDSYIYTNREIKDESDFKNQLKEINIKIGDMAVSKIEKAKEDLFIVEKKPYYELYKMIKKADNSYEIRVHTKGKSKFTRIQEAKEGEVYLRALSREASQIGVDINSTYSEEEDMTMLHRTDALLYSIKEEIKSNTDNEEAYKDKLVRYYKFFKYREIKLRLKTEKSLSKNLIEALVGEIEDDELNDGYKILEKKLSIETFIDKYKNDIWSVAISMVITNAIFEREVIRNYIRKICDLAYNSDLQECSYIERVYMDYLAGREVRIVANSYATLDKYTNRKMNHYANMHSKLLKDEFSGVRLKGIGDNILESFGLCNKEFIRISKIVSANSQRLQRMYLNAVYSKVFKVRLSDEVMLSCYDKKGITYGALRVLVYLRNMHFNVQHFLSWEIDVMSSDNLQKVDYTIFEVIGAFKKYVVNPNNIDDLILIHKYTCDVWKNGAKHLYFYTLHNQEHAVDLIKNIIKIVKTFSYLRITGYDYYIVFIACYLHDISMVRIASRDDFLLDDQTSNTIVTSLDKIWKKNKSVEETKKAIVKTYKELDTFFENKIRSRHAKESAEEIRCRSELSFLEPSVRENVAEIAESHMMDVKDIYFLKGDAKSKLISYKFDKILLRFADLLDMSEHRVSKPILNHNIDNMSVLSAFHWVSHLLTEGYSLTSEYLHDSGGDNIEDTLVPGKITEKVTLTIFVNLSQFSKMKENGCKHAKIKEETIQSDGFELHMLTNGEECSSNKCNFLCKWFNKKNNYLVGEMQALEAYMNRIPLTEKFYKTLIVIKIVVLKPTDLVDEQFDILKKSIT